MGFFFAQRAAATISLMTARTHDLAALVAFTVYCIIVPPAGMTVSTVLVALLANQIGGIVPDIDQPTAPFWRNLPVGRYFGRVFGAVVGGHRFLCHSVAGLVAFGFLSKVLLEFVHPLMPKITVEFVWIGFMIGMLSHLVMDTLTKEGVPWLLPLPYKFGLPPVRRLRITTGKNIENFVVLPLLVIILIWLFANHYNQMLDIVLWKLQA